MLAPLQRRGEDGDCLAKAGLNSSTAFKISFLGGCKAQQPPGVLQECALKQNSLSFCSSRDYSAPVSFVSAGLRKSAAEEISDDDSDEDEKPVKQEEIPKEFVPKKLKTVSSPGNLLFSVLYL